MHRRQLLARWWLAVGLLALLTLAGSGCSTESVSSSSSTAGDVRTLPAGKAVILAEKSVPGKVTIFDFYADWCLPCALITPELEKLVQKRPDELALRKVDVIGWGSDAAMHQNIEYLPYLAVVDADGKVVAEGDDSYTYLNDRYGLDLVRLLTS